MIARKDAKKKKIIEENLATKYRAIGRFAFGEHEEKKDGFLPPAFAGACFAGMTKTGQRAPLRLRRKGGTQNISIFRERAPGDGLIKQRRY